MQIQPWLSSYLFPPTFIDVRSSFWKSRCVNPGGKAEELEPWFTEALGRVRHGWGKIAHVRTTCIKQLSYEVSRNKASSQSLEAITPLFKRHQKLRIAAHQPKQ